MSGIDVCTPGAPPDVAEALFSRKDMCSPAPGVVPPLLGTPSAARSSHHTTLQLCSEQPALPQQPTAGLRERPTGMALRLNAARIEVAGISINQTPDIGGSCAPAPKARVRFKRPFAQTGSREDKANSSNPRSGAVECPLSEVHSLLQEHCVRGCSMVAEARRLAIRARHRLAHRALPNPTILSPTTTTILNRAAEARLGAPPRARAAPATESRRTPASTPLISKRESRAASATPATPAPP